MSKIEILCPTCSGAGKICPAELQETFDAIPKKGATALELHDKLKHGESTTQNARLERLRTLGFVTRHREGRYFRYFCK